MPYKKDAPVKTISVRKIIVYVSKIKGNVQICVDVMIVTIATKKRKIKMRMTRKKKKSNSQLGKLSKSVNSQIINLSQVIIFDIPGEMPLIT